MSTYFTHSDCLNAESAPDVESIMAEAMVNRSFKSIPSPRSCWLEIFLSSEKYSICSLLSVPFLPRTAKISWNFFRTAWWLISVSLGNKALVLDFETSVHPSSLSFFPAAGLGFLSARSLLPLFLSSFDLRMKSPNSCNKYQGSH